MPSTKQHGFHSTGAWQLLWLLCSRFVSLIFKPADFLGAGLAAGYSPFPRQNNQSRDHPPLSRTRQLCSRRRVQLLGSESVEVVKEESGPQSVPATELRGSALGLLFQEQDVAAPSRFIYLNKYRRQGFTYSDLTPDAASAIAYIH